MLEANPPATMVGRIFGGGGVSMVRWYVGLLRRIGTKHPKNVSNASQKGLNSYIFFVLGVVMGPEDTYSININIIFLGLKQGQ